MLHRPVENRPRDRRRHPLSGSPSSCLRSRTPRRSRTLARRPATRRCKKCIDGAQSGDRIEIATATPIVEYLTIKKCDHAHRRTQRGADHRRSERDHGREQHQRPGERCGHRAGGATRAQARRARACSPRVGERHRPSLHRDRLRAHLRRDRRRREDARTARSSSCTIRSRPGPSDRIVLSTTDAGSGTFTIAGNRLTSAVAENGEAASYLRLDGSGTIRVDVAQQRHLRRRRLRLRRAPPGIHVSARATACRLDGEHHRQHHRGQRAQLRGDHVLSAPATAKLKVNIYNNILSGNANGVSFPPQNAKLTIANGYNDQYPVRHQLRRRLPVGGVEPRRRSEVRERGQPQLPPETHLSARQRRLRSAPGSSDLDADDHLRIAGGAVDIGAYEVGSSAGRRSHAHRQSEPSAIAQGGQVTYTLHLVNGGPSPAVGAAVTLPLPAGARLSRRRAPTGAVRARPPCAASSARCARAKRSTSPSSPPWRSPARCRRSPPLRAARRIRRAPTTWSRSRST